METSQAKDTEIIEHEMTLYVADAFGFEIPGTEFKINVTIIKENIVTNKCEQKSVTKITLQFPAINFETGPFANNIYETNNPVINTIIGGSSLFLPPPQNGGYVYTKKGFLPDCLRPNEVLTRSFFGPNNNGQNIPFHYIPSFSSPAVSEVTFTAPISGFLLRITNSGGLVLEGAGTMANIIPPGTQQLLPTTVSYIVKPNLRLGENTQISEGAINIAQYGIDNTFGSENNVRDHHINDAFDNVVAFAWTDNSNIANPTVNFNSINLAYAIGKVKNGKLKMRKAQFLPTPEGFIFDTNIAINRSNKKNIVLSYGFLNNSIAAVFETRFASATFAAVSFDGGKTWPNNGPTNVQPTGSFPGTGGFIAGGFGDLVGAKADKFGNFWYVATNRFDSSGNVINQPFVMASSNMGQSWQLIFTFPYDDTNPIAFYDYPAVCFGGDGQGNYGIHIYSDLFPAQFIGDPNGIGSHAFIPIIDLGIWNATQVQFTNLPQLMNNIFTPSIAASEDGRFWVYGNPAGLVPAEYPFPGGFTNDRIVFKSPGPIDQNYAGPWGIARYNTLQDSTFFPVWEAAPVFGFFKSNQTIIFDEKRKALYVIINAPFSELSNDSKIYLFISRNNGASWSNPIFINSADKNNRGFPSMALDIKTGNLVFGWYDCRNSKDGLSFNYFGAVLTADFLDRITKDIPHSNPIYSIPAGGFDIVPTSNQLVNKQPKEILKSRSIKNFHFYTKLIEEFKKVRAMKP